MALSEQFLQEDLHPIDIVEHIAEHHDWDFDRIADDQIAMAVEGQWRTYSITLAWSAYDETLRLVCSFEMEPPEEKVPGALSHAERCERSVLGRGLHLWKEPKLMVYRYGLVMAGGLGPCPEQIDTLITAAVMSCERYYPGLPAGCLGRSRPQGCAASRHCRGLRARVNLPPRSFEQRGGSISWTCHLWPNNGLVLLGCGKMGSAMLQGWLADGLPIKSVWVIDP